MPPSETLWDLEPHTLGKHRVLKHYLDAWFPILGTWAGRILFIDGFAGPGEYKGGEDGSPLIALRVLKDHRAKGSIKAEVVFGFVERDQDRADHLKRLVRRLKPELPKRCQVSVMQGRFDEKMTELLDAIDRQNKTLAPAFVMVDPFGVSDTPMEVIRRILRNPRSEAYISFMYEPVNRFKERPEFEPHLDRLFGCGAWRQAFRIQDPHRRKQFLFDLYAEQLRAAGAKHVVKFELYEGDRLVYAIFFGTQNSKGADRMKQAIWKVAPFGDFAFHGTHSAQLTLDISNPDFGPLRSALQAEFKGKGWVPIRNIEEFVASDRTDYHSGQLRRGALVPLEEAGQIEVDASTRNKARTFPPSTHLRFL